MSKSKINSNEEITILELGEKDYIIEVTNLNLKIKQGPFSDPILYMLASLSGVLPKIYGRTFLPSVKIREIPLRNIVSISIENNLLKINWIDRKAKNKSIINELKLKIKNYKARLIREVIFRIIKGEDPIKLAREYNEYRSGFFEVLEGDDSIVIVKGDYIEIHNPEMFKIATGKVPLIAPNPALIQLADLCIDRIPIDEVEDLELNEKKYRRGLKYEVKIKLRSGYRRVIFSNRDRAEKFIDIVSRMINLIEETSEGDYIYIKRRIKLEEYVPSIKDWRRQIWEDLSKILVLFMIFYIFASEFIGRGLLTLLLGITLSLVMLIIWKRLRGE